MLYTNIVDLALSYSDRQDDEVVSRIDLFLRIVESRINRRLSTLKMSTRVYTPLVLDEEYYDLPSDFLAVRGIKIVSGTSNTVRKTLNYVNPEQMGNIKANSGTGDYYTIISGRLHIHTAYDADYRIEIEYFQRLVPLTATVTSNWVSEFNPDCYVFGLMVEINSFVKDAAAKDLWDIRFKESLEEIDFQDSKSTWSGTALNTKVG